VFLSSLPFCFIVSLFLYVPPRDGSLCFVNISLSSVCTHGIVFLVLLYLFSFALLLRSYRMAWSIYMYKGLLSFGLKLVLACLMTLSRGAFIGLSEVMEFV